MIFFTECSKNQNIRLPTNAEINKQLLPHIHAHTDNEGVISRIATQLSWNYLSPGCTLAPDWDVINQICEVMNNSLPTTVLEHVKGHQDNKVSKHKSPLPAQLNVEADELAGHYQTNHKEHDRSKALRFPANNALLHSKDTTISSKYPSKLRFHMTFPKIQEYLIQRNNWSKDLFHSIDWDSHRMAIIKTSLPRQFVNKLIHRHLPVATKTKMYDRHETDLRCMCKAEIETQYHLFKCKHKDMISHRRLLYQRIRKQCDSMDTDPRLRDTLLQGLESYLEGKHYSPEESQFPNLVQQQTSLGWHQLLQGRFHLDWNCLHKKHSNKPTFDGHFDANWTVSITHLIWQWAHEYWTIRNATRHGKEQELFNMREKEKAAREVTFLYGLEQRTCAKDREIFDIPLEEQLQSDTKSLINLATMWRPVVLHSLSRATTLAITHVRSIRDYFKPP